jgi:hypothetical protein
MKLSVMYMGVVDSGYAKGMDVNLACRLRLKIG